MSWLAAFAIAALAAAAIAGATLVARVARRAASEPAPRAAAVAIAAAAALVGAAAVYVFGVAPARDGDARIHRGAAGSAPQARLFLRQVQLPVDAHRLGYSPEADVVLPRSYRLAEAQRGWDLVELEIGDGRVAARPIERPETTPTRLRFFAGGAAPTDADLAALARRCGDPMEDDGAAGAHVAVALCDGRRPRAVLEIDPAASGAVLTPWVWRGRRLEPHHIEIEPGSLVQLGSITDAVPGVAMWEVPAPAARSELFAAPDNLLAGCDAFSRSVYAGDKGGTLTGSGAVCPLPLAPPFALEVRRLLPDVAGVALRATWTWGLLLAPLFGWTLLLALRRRGQLRWGELGALVRFAGVSVAAAGVGAARLLWAHRIDMLRDWEIAGARVAANQVSIAILAAALAGCAAVCASGRRRGWACLAAFVATLILAGFGLPDGVPFGFASAGQLALGAALASAPLWHRRLADLADATSPVAAALAVAAAALASSRLFPRAVILKLALSWIAVVVCYRAVRAAVNAPGKRSIAAIAAAALVVVALAAFDTGLAAVIAAPGLLFAVALAGHDALFSDAAAAEVDSFRLRQAPLLAIQGGILAAALAALFVWSVAGLGGGGDGTLAQRLTWGAPHLLWLCAALLAAPAWIGWRRGERRVAALFAGAAVLAVLAWLARDLGAELVLGSRTPAAQRYAVIADPGYSLLADPDAFLAGVTAWAETIAHPGADLWRGAGLFGAQLLDPGVLLSVENDYLPVLMLRELGALGVALHAAAALGVVGLTYALGRERFRHASVAARARLVLAAVLALLIVYQPLASLGALPLTGVSWPGLGIDSPSDLWALVAILVWLTGLTHPGREIGCMRCSTSFGPMPLRGSVRASVAGELESYDRELRARRRFRRRQRLATAVLGLAAVAGVALLARASLFALRRPAPVGPDGLASAPFAGLEAALDYARGLRCEIHSEGGAVSTKLYGQPTDRGTRRFHRQLARRWNGGDLTFGLVHIDVDGESCRVSLESRVLRALRLKPREPYKGARVRLVSRPMGRAATDRGELVSGDLVIRLRGTAEPMAAPTSPGLYAARRVELSDEVAVSITGGGQVVLDRGGAERRAATSWLFISSSRPAGRLRPLEPSAHWTPIPEGEGQTVLDRPALLVVGRGAGRSVWLFRPAGDAGAPPLLADDGFSVTGERRRLYVYGNQLPELGWVNRFRRDMSLGLDGWVAAALAGYDPDKPAPAPKCGTLSPEPADVSRVCHPVADEAVIECQVSLQPELSLRLRALNELVAAAPDELSASKRPLPLEASFFLMRGDTGEIVAKGEHVPGRASSAYAPATPALETYLIRAREDRDPRTGRKLPRRRRGESSAEKVQHNRPIAIGSLMKPMMARALEQTAPSMSRFMVLTGSPFEGALCRGGAHAVLGHCPPTDSLWNHRGTLDTTGFLAHSANWYQASIGLLGTALPDGELGLGDGPALGLDAILDKNVGDHPPDWALWTRRGGETVISADHHLDVAALRRTPMWRRFEAILGRPLCTAGNKRRCRRQAERRDLCAARALPVADVSRDLRYLVSLGPDRFDFYPQLKRKGRHLERVSTREYLQFLRGSGLHPLGSLAQIVDAFNRLVFEAGRDPLRHGGYALAASWFPVPAAGAVPRRSCAGPQVAGTVAAGLCATIREGTAVRLRKWLDDPAVTIYGVKTGTVDSLGDVAASRRACKRYRQARPLAGRRRAAASQPYWIDCRRHPGANIDDSLLLVSFTVRGPDGPVPLTLGLAFQRSGPGFAVRVAGHYLTVIRDYFAGGGGLP